MGRYSDRTQPTLRAEPPSWRHANGRIHLTLTVDIPAEPSGMPPRRQPAQSTVLGTDQLRAIIASYLTIPELVSIRRVSRSWLQMFGEACWQSSCFEPTGLQLASRFSYNIKLTSMPLLEGLLLPSESTGLYASDMKSINELVQQLAAGRNTALKRLRTCVRLSPAIVAGLPRLEQLHYCNQEAKFDLAPFIVEALPQSLTSLKVDSIKHDDKLVSALISRPLRQLQSLGKLWANAEQLRKVLAMHRLLTAIDLDLERHSNDDTAAIVTELQSAARLTRLTLRNAKCTADLVDALCELPRLVHLTVHAYKPELDFWQRVPQLRRALINNLPAEQRPQHHQRVQLSVLASWRPHYTSDTDNECSLAALKASFHCNRIACATPSTLSTKLWKRVLAETRHERSVLQHIDHKNHSYDSIHLSKFLARHRDFTSVHIECFSSRAPIWKELAAFPRLESLVLSGGTHADIRQHVYDSGCLPTLKRLSQEIKPYYGDNTVQELRSVLQMTRDAVSLRDASIRAPLELWAELTLAEIRQQTQHAGRLELCIVQTNEESRRTADEMVRDVLLLTNLDKLSVTKPESLAYSSGWRCMLTNHRELARIRRSAGLNSVYYNADLL